MFGLKLVSRSIVRCTMSTSRVSSAGLTVMFVVAATMIAPGLFDVARSSERVARVSVKGNRVAVVRDASRSTVAAALSSGGRDNFTVTLRDRHGAVVYVSDRLNQVTRVAKNTNIVAIPVPSELVTQAVPVSSQPTPRIRRVPVGCDRLVSVLVKSAAADIPGRCMT